MTMKRLAVIGDPIGHSLSPFLHNMMAAELGLPYGYEACRVSADALPAWLERVRSAGIAGFNATMPHKLRLVPLVDRLTEQAVYFGAVNSVRNDGGVLIGHNTDGDGFARMMASHEVFFQGSRVTILGAGGAAGAIARKAVQDGAAAVRIMNRTLENARTLCRTAPGIMSALPLGGCVPADTQVLVSTIPAGNCMDWSFVERLSGQCVIFDILYAPPKTELLLASERRGLRSFNGLGMLIWQAILAFSFFTGAKFDQAQMALRLEAAVRKL